MYLNKIHFSDVFMVMVLHLTMTVPVSAQNIEEKKLSLPASVITNASDQYSQPTLLQVFFMGKNYRSEWATPVQFPVFDIKSFGLTVTELGGGRQTKSLRMKDADSVEWALRTVDKDVSPALPKIIRNKLTVSIVQDMVSAANPYAPLTIPVLAEAVGVPAARSRFFYVPEDTALGQYYPIFANTVCLLEKRDLLPGVNSKGTMKMLEDIFEDHHALLNQKAYLTARLLDMLIADWDRHYDQWKWAALDSGGKTVFLALPKDRDQAYFYSQGWLLRFIRLFGMKFSVGLSSETSNLVGLNSIALNLDRLLLNGLSRADWQQIAAQFQQNLTDDVIRKAIKELPEPIFALHGKTITAKLLQRKMTLPQDLMKYYALLAKKVTVYGTDKAERFWFSGGRDSVTLTVSSTKNEQEVYYKRTFYPEETKKIKLLGLDGDDVFVFDEGWPPGIGVEINGGKGHNEYKGGDTVHAKMKDSSMDAKEYLKKLRKPLRVQD